MDNDIFIKLQHRFEKIDSKKTEAQYTLTREYHVKDKFYTDADANNAFIIYMLGCEAAMEILSENRKISVSHHAKCVPYQICPKCDGTGWMTAAPGGWPSAPSVISNTLATICDVCDGGKVIPMHIVD